MKTCTKCGEEKPLSDYYKNRNSCKTCDVKTTRDWQNKNPERAKKNRRISKLRCKYNITYAEYEEMKVQQKGLCEICEEQLVEGPLIAVDHCHRTGNVRAILCRKCNLGIGNLQDSIKILESAVRYLKKYS